MNESDRPSSSPSSSFLSSSPPLAHPDPFLSYTSLGIIGRGKYSEVHKARNVVTGEIVAMKKVQIFDMDSSGRHEVLNEANILQSLPSHPHIIQYKHCYLYANDLYLVLELAEYGDIGLLLEAQRQKGTYFREAEIWEVFVQIAEALAVMHECRVMHRDIKPANVFLTAAPVPVDASSSSASAAPSSSLGLSIKLGDLGLGRYLSSKTYETFSMVGTPFYMSPESIANTGYHFKSDIWSCGCLLYEIAALKSPFYSTSLNFYTLGNKITKGEYDRAPAHFSKTLHSLLSWMLSPSPSSRPDIRQVLIVAQHACESIRRTGAVSDAIQVGETAPAAAASAASSSSSSSTAGGMEE